MMGFFYLLVACVCLTSIHALPIEEASLSGRIANGVAASDNHFPYVVSIQRQDIASQAEPTRGHVCGGVLISFQHILTSAGCTFTINATDGSTIPIVPSAYRVFAGSSLLTSDTSADRIRNIANYTIHPQYIRAPAHFNDIAVITLSSPFPEGVAVPLALPPNDYNPADFTLCTVAGWGAASYTSNTPSTQLLYTNKYVYNQELCTKIYNGEQGAPNIFPSMMCAASYNIISSGCDGDEGNALVCDGNLAGISFLTSQCSASSFPELYTRVSDYTSWIRSVSSSGTFKPGLYIVMLFSILHVVVQKVVN